MKEFEHISSVKPSKKIKDEDLLRDKYDTWPYDFAVRDFPNQLLRIKPLKFQRLNDGSKLAKTLKTVEKGENGSPIEL